MMKEMLDAIIEKASENAGEEVCPKCGTSKRCKVTNPFTGKEQTVPCLCRCEAEERDAQEERAREEERRRRVERARAASFDGADYSRCRFEGAEQDDNLEKARKYAERFEAFREKGRGLLFFGDVGTGKTFAAACIANKLVDMGYSVKMTNFPRLVAAIQKDGFKADHLRGLDGYDLLVIDDLGVERDSAYMQEQVYAIVDGRYRAGKPLVVTTNLTAEQLKNPGDVMSARIYGRILENCLPMRFTGPDRRRKNACYAEMQAMLNG